MSPTAAAWAGLRSENCCLPGPPPPDQAHKGGQTRATPARLSADEEEAWRSLWHCDNWSSHPLPAFGHEQRRRTP